MGEDFLLTDAATNAYNTTTSYASTSFAGRGLSLAGSYADRGYDGNANGLYDALRVDVGLNVETAGTYTVSGQLFSGAGDMLPGTQTSSVLAAGLHTVTLSFDGKTIRQHRANGPLLRGILRIKNSNGDKLQVAMNAYTTTAYTFTAFNAAPSS